MEPRFSRIGLIGREGDPRIAETLTRIARLLGDRGIAVVTDSATRASWQGGEARAVERSKLADQTDLVIVVGGDGSMLGAAETLAHSDVPLLGVNLGRLGFLADVSPERIEEQLDAVLAGEFTGERRHLLEGGVVREAGAEAPQLALNDVVVQKSATGRMIEVETFIDDNFVCAHRADGIIVATPTGSTAYALSGGGPIVHPDVDALVVVPICPHTLSDRPIVVRGASQVDIVLHGGHGAPAQVSWDGQRTLPLAENDRVKVRRCEQAITLIHPPGYEYFDLLRTKLHWGRSHANGIDR
jgi:NAD+ kinase